MTTPEWHAEAKRLFAEGITVGAISRRLGKPHGTVAWAVNLNNTRQRNYERVRAQRDGRSQLLVRPPVRSVRKKLAAAAQAEPVVEQNRKPTLPHISISAVSDRPIIRKYAPPIRKEMPSEGVERWRFHHLKMIREGRIPAPGLDPDIADRSLRLSWRG